MNRRLLPPVGILAWLLVFAPPVHAQDVIINELYNSSTQAEEWVELLVVADSADVRGWTLRDFSTGGSAQTPLTFTQNAAWSGLRQGTIVLIGAQGSSIAEDLDAADNLLVIRASNVAYFSGSSFNVGASSDALQLRTASSVHVTGVSWGAANAASLPSPRVHFDGSLSSGATINFTEDSLPELVLTGAWAFNSTASTPGAGNAANNVAWIASLRANPDGSGSASVSPDTLLGGDLFTLALTYRRDPAYTISDLRILVPPNFSWDRSTASVSATNLSATTSVNGDTILFAGLTMTADSTVITVGGMFAPDSTAFYPITVETKGATSFRPVGPLPRIVLFGSPQAIATVKENDPDGVPRRINTLVTVQGVVTVANQFGGPSYLQDVSGGMAVFGSSFSTAVTIGDEVVVSGLLQPFNGLSEIVNPFLHGVVSTANTVTPLPATAAGIRDDGADGVEDLEGRLVRVDGVSVLGSGVWLANTNYPLVQVSDTTQLRIDNQTDLVGLPLPGSAFDVVGVVGQYVTAPPYVGGYQLMPRFSEDMLSSGPVIATLPVETEITPNSLTIEWETVYPGSTHIRYGRTPALELGSTGRDSLATAHSIRVEGLESATIYYLQAFSFAGGDTSAATPLIASTASPPASTGAVNCYFTATVNPSVALFGPARGEENLVARLVERIALARRSVDAAFYNLSGTPGPGMDIANALINAARRGVRVRVICEKDNSTNAPFDALSASTIPILTDGVDPVLKGTGLMHNKFVVIDGRGGAPESTWVWTGSWNPTESGTFDDYQNAIEIQDAALAGAFTREFEEMWGTQNDLPDYQAVRFGSRKTDNTPHRFVIGNRMVSCYFSPSDRTTTRLIESINSASHSVAFGLLTMTRSDVSAALVARHSAGLKVRGVLNDDSDTGSQYPTLVAGGVDVHLKSGPDASTYLLHHKYGLIDAEDPAWDPAVITGSHNWTNAAENANDENTIILRDARTANHFLQEFTARYYQYGGTDSITVGVSGNGTRPRVFRLEQNYPNPFNPQTTIRFHIPARGVARLAVYDLLGRQVAVLADGMTAPGSYSVVFDGAGLASGVYLCRLTFGGVSQTKGLLLVR